MTKRKPPVDLTPMYCSPQAAAAFLDVSVSRMYELLDERIIDGRYEGKFRKVNITSLREYAMNLPADAPEEVA